MGTIMFNKKSSRDFGLEVETFPNYEIPERIFEKVSVPGRNGEVIFDTGAYKNSKRSYKVSLATYDEESYSVKMNQIAEWLHSSSGYARLEDSYDEDFFRYAYYSGSLSIENLFDEAGRATLDFECKPQRYYKYGEIPIEFTTNGKIQNKTPFTSLPVIHVYIGGNQAQSTVTIGNYGFTILANSGTNLIVDSELQDAYYGTENKNHCISFGNRNFPKLLPGLSNVSFTGDVYKIEITPRWWTI